MLQSLSAIAQEAQEAREHLGGKEKKMSQCGLDHHLILHATTKLAVRQPVGLVPKCFVFAPTIKYECQRVLVQIH